jgi:hypothetical protein
MTYPVLINVKLKEDVADRLKATARREGNGVSSVVRRLLAVALEAEQRNAREAEKRSGCAA